jgi:hypothetical protein
MKFRTCWTLAAVALMVAFVAGGAFAQDDASRFTPRYIARPARTADIEAARNAQKSGSGLQTWTGSFTYKGTKYTYEMLGTNPAKGSATTTITLNIIPLAVKVGSTTFDPTKPLQSACGVSGTAEKFTLGSPLFANTVTYKQGGTNVGTTQYEDAVQRADFWSSVSKTSPDYHVLIQYKLSPKQTLDAGSNGVEESATCPNGSTNHFADVNINTFENTVQNLITKLKIPSNEIAYFLTYDVFEYEGNPEDCCILGYHSVFNGVPYGTGSYGDVAFQCNGCGNHGFTDIVTMSHEIGETINDPFTDNGVPVWKSAEAPQYGCSGILEIGDPLAGLPEPVTVPGNSHQFYVQDLAFEQWFALVPNGKSTSVNKWYSMFGTFKNIDTNLHSECVD